MQEILSTSVAVPKTFAREIEQLRAVNFHFSFALDHVAEAVAIVEADPLSGLGPQIVYANRAMRVATGYSESEIVRLPFGRVYDEFKLAELLRRLMAEMPAERPASFVGCLTAKSGERIPGDWSIRAVLDEEGTPVNYTVSFCPKPVPAATPEVAKPAAPAPAEALEPADEPAVPKPINGSAAPVAAPSKKLAPLFAIASQNGTAAANGSLSPAEATAPKVAEPERKSLEEQERESNDQIFRRSRMESLAFMASGIAHDFNNVLTPIMGGISVLEDKLENGEPFEGEAVRAEITEMARAADKARLLAQKILHFAKGTTAPKKPTHLGRLLEDSICVSTRGGNVTCATDLAADLWESEVDAVEIMQVFNNLLINARQAMPKGGPIRARAWNLRVGADSPLAGRLSEGRYVAVAVADKGCGIPKEALQKIFERFYTTKPEGSGVGLATSFSIVQRHGGLIDVDSTEGVGTTFTVYLPACEPSAAPGSEPERPASAAPPAPAALPKAAANGIPAGKGSVLFIDDEPQIQRLGIASLKRAGYDVEAAETGEMGVKLFNDRAAAGNPFSLIITDKTLPGGMSGEEVMEAILAKDPQALVLLCSGYVTDAEADREFMQKGFAGVIAKPFTVQSLSQTVAVALGQAEEGSVAAAC